MIIYYGFALMKLVKGNCNDGYHSASFMLQSHESFGPCWLDYNTRKDAFAKRKDFVRWICSGIEQLDETNSEEIVQ